MCVCVVCVCVVWQCCSSVIQLTTICMRLLWRLPLCAVNVEMLVHGHQFMGACECPFVSVVYLVNIKVHVTCT